MYRRVSTCVPMSVKAHLSGWAECVWNDRADPTCAQRRCNARRGSVATRRVLCIVMMFGCIAGGGRVQCYYSECWTSQIIPRFLASRGHQPPTLHQSRCETTGDWTLGRGTSARTGDHCCPLDAQPPRGWGRTLLQPDRVHIRVNQLLFFFHSTSPSSTSTLSPPPSPPPTPPPSFPHSLVYDTAGPNQDSIALATTARVIGPRQPATSPTAEG